MRATHAKKKQLLYEYKLGGEAILITNSTAYPGVELSSDLKWNTHVMKTASRQIKHLESCVETSKTARERQRIWLTSLSSGPRWNTQLQYGIHTQRTTFNSWKQFSTE